MDNNPTESIDAIKVDKKVITTFNDEELEKIRMACVSKRDIVMVEFLYSTGLRIAGAVSIKIKDVDWTTGQFLVTEKGGKERVVVMNGRAIVRLKDYILDRKGPKNDDSYLFTQDNYPYKPLTTSGFRTALERIGKSADIQKPVNPHQYRRKFATDALRRGCPIDELADMMGHSNYTTTKQYLTISQDRKIQSFNKYTT